MNKVTTLRELSPNKDMKYKLRFITIHEGQGGGYQGNEEGTEDEEASQAHYFGSFEILQHRSGAKSTMKMLR